MQNTLGDMANTMFMLELTLFLKSLLNIQNTTNKIDCFRSPKNLENNKWNQYNQISLTNLWYNAIHFT